MPTTQAFELYRLSELSGRARERANSYIAERVSEDGWDDDVLSDWREKLEAAGFMRPQIYYSHMYCQGRGACFVTRDGIDIEKWIKVHKLGNKYRHLLAAYKRGECAARTYHYDNLYHHYNTMYIATEFNYIEGRAEVELEEVVELMLEEARDFAKDIYRDLENEHMSITSEESLADYADGYGFLFMEDGYKIEGDD